MEQDAVNNNENSVKVCPTCHQNILDDFYFCPNCGASLKEKIVPVSIIVQIGLYALALFLPPLGLWPGIKYLSKPSQQAKMVGGVVIALTLISSVVSVWAIFSIFNGYMDQVNDLMIGM